MSQTLKEAFATLGLVARQAATSEQVSADFRLGQAEETLEFSDADYAQALKIEADSASDVATLTCSTGAVAQTTGTPTITAGDGKDLEGNTFDAVGEYFAILIKNTGTGSIAVVSSDDDLPDIPALQAGGRLLLAYASEKAMSGTVAFTFANAAGEVEVSIIGKVS